MKCKTKGGVHDATEVQTDSNEKEDFLFLGEMSSGELVSGMNCYS